MELCCECEPAEDADGKGNGLIEVDSASSNEEHDEADSDNEPGGFLMFENHEHRRVSVARRVSRRSSKKQSEPAVEPEETKEKPHEYKVTYSTQKGEFPSTLKLYGNKADGGFMVEGADSVHLQLDWYKSSDIIFDDDFLSISFLNMMHSFSSQISVTFESADEFRAFQDIHDKMIPSQDIFREFAGSFKRTPEERKLELEETKTPNPECFKPIERKRKYLVDPADVKSYAFIVHKEKQSFF